MFWPGGGRPGFDPSRIRGLDDRPHSRPRDPAQFCYWNDCFWAALAPDLDCLDRELACARLLVVQLARRRHRIRTRLRLGWLSYRLLACRLSRLPSRHLSCVRSIPARGEARERRAGRPDSDAGMGSGAYPVRVSRRGSRSPHPGAPSQCDRTQLASAV
jgi:hypothetical protein